MRQATAAYRTRPAVDLVREAELVRAPLAGAAGPCLGGLRGEWTWRAVFLINLPLAVLVVVVTLRHVPESRDPDSPPGLDVTGAVLTVLALGGLTYGMTGLSNHGPSLTALLALAAGVLALAAFVLVERRSPHPLVPPLLFADNIFRVTNAMTLLIYGALGAVFLLLVLQLQTVAGFSPVASGTALLPFTAVMLLFSSRAGALAARIGPRLPMTIGPLVAAAGMLLMLRIGADASWIRDVLPAALVFGAGMALVVAPLTAAVLDSAPDNLAGSASGVNNAIARSGGLLAVAVIPGLAGISGAEYDDPVAFSAGFHTAIVIAAGLLCAASVLAVAGIRRRRPDVTHSDRIRVEECPHCAINGPPAHPASAHPSPP